MAERTARLGTIFYHNADGRYRRAYAGDTVQVHSDDVERFDRLNVLPGEETPDEPKKAAPKPKPRKAASK